MAITTGANVPKVTAEDIERARQDIIAKTGRPSKFSSVLASEICLRLESGETLTRICKDGHMPAIPTIHDWMGRNADFANAVARARKLSGHVKVDAGLDAVEKLSLERLDANGNPVKVSMAEIRLAEVQFRSGLEVAKAYDRDTFGDKRQITADISVEHTVGGIIDLVMGQTKPLVALDAEVADVPLIGDSEE